LLNLAVSKISFTIDFKIVIKIKEFQVNNLIGLIKHSKVLD